MEYKKIFSLFIILISSICSAQQNEEFTQVKNYYDYQRKMISQEMKKRFDQQETPFEKATVKSDYKLFMSKIDSLENGALVMALIKIKNKEGLKLSNSSNENSKVIDFTKTNLNVDAKPEYPGGLTALREFIAAILYSDCIDTEQKSVKTMVTFTVDREGSVVFTDAVGDLHTFNRQAEIALYLLPQKFKPATYKGNPVPYRFTLPITLNFE